MTDELFKQNHGDSEMQRLTGIIKERDEAIRKLQEQESTLCATQENLKEHIAQLKRLDISRNQFVAMLAHELRNPLAPISTALPILRSGNQTQCTRFLDIIERQVHNMKRLIDGLLDVSRVLSGKMTIHHEIVNIRTVIEHSAETIRPLISEKNHNVTLRLPSAAMYTIGDKVRLEQVFSSLLHNAAKYTDRNGFIEMEAREDGDTFVVQITDTGCGIAAETLPLIWEVFMQAENSLERTEGGLGLGLTIVKNLVELHGGSVEAHSEGIGTGSCFYVRLPTLAALRGRAMNKEESPKRIMKILVVDDNVDAAESLCCYLQMSQHEVDIVHDGQKAIEACQAKQYEIVLLDIGLPKINGFEVCKRLRDASYQAAIIAITGYDQDEDKARSKEVGFDRHMTKPIDPDRLEDVLLSIPPKG